MISSERYCFSCGAVNQTGTAVCFACGRSLKITVPLVRDTADQPLLGERYRILSQLGSGGFSAVYKAADTLSNNQLVAIKAISLKHLSPSEIIEATEAFNREIQVLADLKHPGIPRVHTHFADAACWYLVVDFIEGVTLERYLEKAHQDILPVGEVLEIALMLCAVLEYLHMHQPAIIFRDLKPANIMMTPDKRIVLIDFGIARYFKAGQAKDTIPFGSPGYAAPEQYGKAQTTPRSDIYSLGVLLHQLLTGIDPAESPFHFAPLPSLATPILVRLNVLIQAMVEVDAEKRPASISIVKQELQALAHEWAEAYTYGVSAKGAYAAHPPSPAFWQNLLPPASVTGVPIAASSGGQLSLLQQLPAGSGPSASASAYWSTPMRQKSHNVMAILSIIFTILSIFIAIVANVSFGFLNAAARFPFANSSSFAIIIFTIPTVISMLSVVFGHIALQRSNTVHGLATTRDMALMALIIGYLFLILYLSLFLSLIFGF
jgi:serine/threonine protein kinase